MGVAIAAVKELFGQGGYRTYARAIGRHPVTFHAAISDRNTRINSLVGFGCHLLRQAQKAGLDPHDLLEAAAQDDLPVYDDRNGVQFTLENLLGPDAVTALARSIPLTKAEVSNHITRDDARHLPHFRLFAVVLLALKQQGYEPRSLVESWSGPPRRERRRRTPAESHAHG